MALANLVRVVTGTTGTGTVTLGAAVSGFLNTTQAGMADGLVYSYAIEADYVAVGDDQVPTSREVGTGTYTASGTTLTRTVVNSTNGNALLNLSGDAQVVITDLKADHREILQAARNYYVRTDGSDSNTGLANTAGAAFLTIQHAIDTVAQLDWNNQQVTINVANGTYNESLSVNPFVGQASTSLVLTGNTGSPSSVVVSGNPAITIQGAVNVILSGFQWTSGSSFSIYAKNGANVTINQASFGASSNAQIACEGALISMGSAYDITAGSNYIHYYVTGTGRMFVLGIAVTIAGTPSYSGAFAYCEVNSYLYTVSVTYSGSGATGKRYNAQTNGIINTGSGASATFFPGNSAGTTATGGQYL